MVFKTNKTSATASHNTCFNIPHLKRSCSYIMYIYKRDRHRVLKKNRAREKEIVRENKSESYTEKNTYKEDIEMEHNLFVYFFLSHFNWFLKLCVVFR